MTLNLFPATPSPSWSVFKAPNFATRLQRATVGRELRGKDYLLPIYTFTLTYNVLRDPWDQRMGYGTGPAFKPPAGSSPLNELRTIWEFYNQQWGSGIPFRFLDNSDNNTRLNPSVPQVVDFAEGDGTSTEFQMTSALSAVVIPNTVVSVVPAISHSIDANTGIITFTSAPASGVLVGADFTYYYKVRFGEDNLGAENFAWQFWQMRTLKLTSVPY